MKNKNTQQIFHAYNNALKKRLLPEPTNTEQIECDSFSDAKDENFDKPLKDVGL